MRMDTSDLKNDTFCHGIICFSNQSESKNAISLFNIVSMFFANFSIIQTLTENLNQTRNDCKTKRLSDLPSNHRDPGALFETMETLQYDFGLFQ